VAVLLVQRLGRLFAFETAAGLRASLDQAGVEHRRFLSAAVAAAVPPGLPWTRLGGFGKDRPAAKALACQILEGRAALTRLPGGGVDAWRGWLGFRGHEATLVWASMNVNSGLQIWSEKLFKG
jgi:hypothetical protein